MPTLYQHQDSLKQTIVVGQPIAFTSSYLKGVKIGIVKKLTKCRVKIHYSYCYTKDQKTYKGSWDTLIEPKRTIQLSEDLHPHITMFMLCTN